MSRAHHPRLKGHKLTMSWSRERGPESSSTGECTCGWVEHGSSQKVVTHEYHWHLLRAMSSAGKTDDLLKLREAGWLVDDHLIERSLAAKSKEIQTAQDLVDVGAVPLAAYALVASVFEEE